MLWSSKLARTTHCRLSLGFSGVVNRLLRVQRNPIELAEQMEQESGEMPMRNPELMDAIRASKKPFIALAPMIDQSELPFRMMMRELVMPGDKSPKENLTEDGTPLFICYTPMMWAEHFVASEEYRIRNFFSCAQDRPLVVQFAGNDPEILVAAAKRVEDFCDAVDLNLGCPQSVAQEKQVGAWMCDDWSRVARCVSALATNVRVPTFCKIRVWPRVEDTVKFALMIQESGCQLLTIHGRTREQGRNGDASWEQIRRVKEALRIPVVANGNIYNWKDIDRCYEATCVDGVMSAEPSLVDPTNIFGEYARQRRNRRRLEILASETTEGAPEKEPPVITTTPNPTTNPNGTSTITHTQLPIALSYLNCVARYPEESTPKRVREHLFHLLGYRQRSFHQFKSKGDNYLKQFLWLNKQVDLRDQFYEAHTTEELTEGVKALAKRLEDEANGIVVRPERKRKRTQGEAETSQENTTEKEV